MERCLVDETQESWAAAPTPLESPGPVTSGERIVTLDVIRGAAILGILMVNMHAFSMPSVVHDNPMAFGDMTGLNYAVWYGMHLLFEGKFHAIFAALFGAGMVLMLERARTRGASPLGVHYRRMLGLLAIGMIHAYLIWYGDILVAYALCGCVVVLFRNFSGRVLVPAGLAMLAVPALFCLGIYALVTAFPEHATQPLMEEWWPSEEALADEVATYQGGWADQVVPRIMESMIFQTLVFGGFTFWRAGGLMLLGIVLFRTGVLTGARSTRFYLTTMVATAIPGLALVMWGVWETQAHAWDPRYMVPFGIQFNYWGSLLVAMAWVCGLVLLARHACRFWLTTSLAAVGRTALSNYLLQSAICTSIFYGHGLGWYGETPRTTQLALVIAIWCLQLVLAPVWLRHFRFGPVEWVWRRATYGRRP